MPALLYLLQPGANAATQVYREPVPVADKPFNLNYGFYDGMFKNHAGAEFTDQIKFRYYHGFRSIEDNGMMGRPKETSSTTSTGRGMRSVICK